MEKISLDIFTLKLAIGTIWFVSIFMFTCGFYNIYPFVEELSKSSTWGIVVTIPTLIFSYCLGAIAVYLSNNLKYKSKKSFNSIDDFLFVAGLENEFITKRHEAMRNQHEFFTACIPTVIFLGISVIWASIRILKSGVFEGEKLVAIGLGVLTIISSIILFKMGKNQRNEIEYFMKELKK